MSQSDYNLGNVTAPAARTKINQIAEATATMNAGETAPATTFPMMLWADENADWVKIRQRTITDDGWVEWFIVEPGSNRFNLLNQTKVVYGGTNVQVGEITFQSTATWEAGTSDLDTLVSPAKVRAAIDAVVGTLPKWDDWAYTLGANEQNNSGQPIRLLVVLSTSASASVTLQVGPTTSQYTNTGVSDAGTEVIIPPGHFYRITASNTSDIAQALILS